MVSQTSSITINRNELGTRGNTKTIFKISVGGSIAVTTVVTYVRGRGSFLIVAVTTVVAFVGGGVRGLQGSLREHWGKEGTGTWN